MITVATDFTDPRRVADASQAIIDLSERLPDVVDELERAEEREPTPHNARALFFTRSTLENLYHTLYAERPELFAPPAKRPRKAT